MGAVKRSVPRIGPWRIVLLLAVTLLAYWPVFSAGWVWDDESYILTNTTLTSPNALREIWLEPSRSPQYYPLVFTGFWIERSLFGNDPRGYHAINLALHLGVVLLAFLVLRKLSMKGATAIALLFALHPMQVESVAWITERKNVLSGVFYFASALAYLRFAPLDDGTARAPDRWRWYAISLALFLAALFSKTVSATLPAALLLVTYWKRPSLSPRALLPLLPFFVLGAGFGGMTAWLERSRVGAVGADWSLSFLERVVLAGRIAWFYPSKLLWPHPLVFIYPRWTIEVNALQLLAPISLAGAVIALFVLRHRLGKGPFVAAAFYLVTLFPALGFLNVYPMRFSYVADHFQYLAALGPLALVVAAWERWRPARFIGIDRGVLAAVVVALGVLCFRQALVYRSGEALWRDTLAKNPSAWIAHNNLGYILAGTGRGTEAMGYYRSALALRPRFAEAHNNLATLYGQQGKLELALAECDSAIAADAEFSRAYFNRALAEVRLGRHEAALADLDRFEKLVGPYARAGLYRGVALNALGRPREALAALDAALKLDPTQADVRNLRAQTAAKLAP